MTSLSMADILTKLRLLFFLVIGLFVIMHVGAGVGILVDVSARRETMRTLLTPERGFQESAGGVWTWRLSHEEMTKAVDAPRGTSVELVSVLAFPFARLRFALPSEMLPGSEAQCVGLRDGFSQSALRATSDDIGAAMQQLSEGFRSIFGSRNHGRIPEIELAPKQSSSSRSMSVAMQLRFSQQSKMSDAAEPSQMVGTALVLAHIANQRALSIVELGERRAAASRHFRGVRMPGVDDSFDSLLAKFMLMLGDDAGSLCLRKSWMLTARTWRLIFLQRADGSFDLTNSLAFALGAHGGPLPPPRTSAIAKLRAKLLKLDDFEDDESEGPDFGAPAEQDADAGRAGSANDCPLTFHRAALLARMPPEMASLRDAHTVWATLLALTFLQASPYSWMVSEEDGEEEETIVDKGRKYLVTSARASRSLRHLLKAGIPQMAAEKAFRRWQAAREHAMELTRLADSVASHRPLHVVQRAISRVLKSIQTDHQTFSVLLDANGFIQRWQRFMILCTLCLCALFTAILFYSSRGQQCCLEIRGLLDAGAGQSCSLSSVAISPPPPFPPPLPDEPAAGSSLLLDVVSDAGCDPALPAGVCLGYTGACGDLPTQFASVQGAFVYGLPGLETCNPTLADYVCHAFPDDAYVTDQARGTADATH
jgi:hypothetical protein